MAALYSPNDEAREQPETGEAAPWRSAFSRDYGRVVHSPTFRRLQGKTQVFPGHESDFFRNRLTHSLEVAQIAEGIADRLNFTSVQLVEHGYKIDSRLCATASLMLDLGHPPFGHNGERALDDSMREHGGFEGNAQTLRIVSRIERKIKTEDGAPLGLGLCYRTLASVLKYDRQIPRSRREGEKLVKGYYTTEADLVKKIKSAVVPGAFLKNKTFKTIEYFIMDAADDIAYSTFDLEDSLKAEFLTPSKIFSSKDGLVKEVAKKVSDALGYNFGPASVLEVFAGVFELDKSLASSSDDDLIDFKNCYKAYSDVANNGHFRTALSSELIRKAINSVELIFDSKLTMLSEARLAKDARERVEALKQYTYVATMYSSRVKLPEFRGYAVVRGIFGALASDRGFLLMPDDVRELHGGANKDLDTQMRVVCDFIAGMTDRYAMEFYGRLHSDTAQSMFKPL